MEPASFFMVLVGCTQGQACKPVMTMPIAYQSEATCLADRAEIVAATGLLGHDRVFAECRRQSGKEQTSARGTKVSVRAKPVA